MWEEVLSRHVPDFALSVGLMSWYIRGVSIGRIRLGKDYDKLEARVDVLQSIADAKNLRTEISLEELNRVYRGEER